MKYLFILRIVSDSSTGRSEGRIGHSESGSGASEAVQSFSGGNCQLTLSNAQERRTECGSNTHIVSSIRYYSTCPPSSGDEWIGENMQDELGFHDEQDPSK